MILNIIISYQKRSVLLEWRFYFADRKRTLKYNSEVCLNVKFGIDAIEENIGGGESVNL